MQNILNSFFDGLKALSPAFLIAQALGPVTTVISIVSSQMKSLKAILLLELAANLLVALTYLLVGGDSGAYICLVACIQTTISFLYTRKGRQCPTALTVVFLCIYIGITIVTYQSPTDILPGLCSVTFALSVVQKNAARYRVYMAINSLLWVVYDLIVGAYSTILTHGLLLISLILAMIRLDRKKAEDKDVQ